MSGLSTWTDIHFPPLCQPLKLLAEQTIFDNKLYSKFEGCITVCCDPQTWDDDWHKWLIQEPNVWLTYGCHPENANSYFDNGNELKLKKFLQYQRVVALGEIGLDETYYEKGQPKSVQVKVFKRQIQIIKSLERPLPLVIHLRASKSNTEVYKLARLILIENGLGAWKIHLHCFNQTLERKIMARIFSKHKIRICTEWF